MGVADELPAVGADGADIGGIGELLFVIVFVVPGGAP